MAVCATIIQLPCMCENLVQPLIALSSGPWPSESGECDGKGCLLTSVISR